MSVPSRRVSSPCRRAPAIQLLPDSGRPLSSFRPPVSRHTLPSNPKTPRYAFLSLLLLLGRLFCVSKYEIRVYDGFRVLGLYCLNW